MTLQTGWPAGWMVGQAGSGWGGYNNIPAFSSESTGIKIIFIWLLLVYIDLCHWLGF